MLHRFSRRAPHPRRWIAFACLLAAGSPAGTSGVWAADSKPATSAKSPPAETFGIRQVAFINDQVRRVWADKKLAPAPPATDGEWCRRLFLDLLGRVPTVDETEAFLADKAADKKLRLVNRLLGDDAYIEEYARNWTTLWTNVLVGRNGGNEENSLTYRPGLQQALRRAFQRNLPYDRLVHELVSATGVNRPESESEDAASAYNGFVNFLSGKLDENGVQATAKTAQIFLGLQVQCTQCHNHPFNEWKQNQFWELNAFFRQTRSLRRYAGGRNVAAVELVDQDFAGEDGNVDEAVLFYELRNGLTKAAYPAFVDGATLATNSGYLDQVNRRAELARLITASDYLPRAIVNRLWAHFLGYGFTKPIDDLGPHNEPSHPELLAGLAKEFQTHSFDLHQLVRWIVLSEPYGLSSRIAAGNRADDPALGEKPAFSHFYLRQMRAEELYESLLVATEAHKTRGGYEQQEAAKRDWLNQFVIAFGTDEADETTTFNGTIPQALMMWNGDLIKKATSTDKGGFLERIASSGKLNNAAKINYLYVAALSRRPTRPEVAAANQLLALRQGNAVGALQDIWWAVLNSNEFILNH